MPWWFSFSYEGTAFVLFGTAHLFMILFLCLLCVIFFLTRKRFRQNEKQDLVVRRSIVTMLLLFEGAYQLWYISNGVWAIHFALPLHLSSIVWITAVLMLLTKRKIWFELTFFVGIASAALTIITPDIGGFGYPHFRYFHFFLTHGLVIVAAVYMLFVHQLKLTRLSVWRVWIWLNIYAGLVFVVNLTIPNANYMYLMRKPAGPSPFDWFGEWPYYLFVLQLVSLGLFWLMYGVYIVLEQRRSKRGS